jgi:hypothetical protein
MADDSFWLNDGDYDIGLSDTLLSSPILNSEINQIIQPSIPIIELVEGFILPPFTKQQGGKNNKTPLQTHAVLVNLTKVSLKVDDFLVEAQLMGYDRLSKSEVFLEVLEKANLVLYNGVFGKAKFKNLVVLHSSHNNGQRLFINFQLVVKKTKEIVCSTKSADFETITKRGQEKTIIKCNNTIVNIDEKVLNAPKKIHLTIEPSISTTIGKELCKISGFQFDNNEDVSKIVILFGGQKVTKDLHIFKNQIFFEIPGKF